MWLMLGVLGLKLGLKKVKIRAIFSARVRETARVRVKTRFTILLSTTSSKES